MTNFYKCAGLLLTQQYENTLIMAPSYMWQYHFLERKSLVSQATAVVHKLSPGEWHWILLLFDWSSHTFDVGQGSLHSKYLVKLKEWCDKYSSNYYHKGKKNKKQLHNAIYLLGLIWCLSQKYCMCSSFRFMELFIQQAPALNLTQSPSEDLAHLAFWQSLSIQQQIIKWHIHYSADWVIIVYKCFA